jgi:catechol 2,3-dioxygenase-like lactoylglutathione lyase family enzyme
MIVKLDHIVLTVASIEATCDFYSKALGFTVREQDGRVALHFGPHKFNLHQAGHEFEPKARRPTPGSADFCLISDEPIAAVQARLEALGIAIEEGPVMRTGAVHPIRSLYFRDPDDNLVEVSNEQPST